MGCDADPSLWTLRLKGPRGLSHPKRLDDLSTPYPLPELLYGIYASLTVL